MSQNMFKVPSNPAAGVATLKALTEDPESISTIAQVAGKSAVMNLSLAKEVGSGSHMAIIEAMVIVREIEAFLAEGDDDFRKGVKALYEKALPEAIEAFRAETEAILALEEAAKLGTMSQGSGLVN